MRKYCKFLAYPAIAAALLQLSAACQSDLKEDMPESSHEVTVGVFAGGAQTKTTMLENGLSAAWEQDDRLAVWAMNQAGTYVLSNQVFKTYGTDSGRGFFTSTLQSAMPQERYTYYCSYPEPLSVSGTQAVFSVPAVQDGKASGGADVMIATPVVAGPLAPIPELDDHSTMAMQMNRMMHQFRFYVPGDNTALGGDKITKLVLTFPENVVGKATLDLADPDAPAVLADGSSRITLNLSSPLSVSASASDVEYACMVMVPAAFASGQMLQVKAYTADRIAVVDPIDLKGRNFQAGHSTPVQLKIKQVTDYPYQLTFKVAANNLGEKPNSITLTAPSSCRWEGYDSNVYTYSPGRKIEVGEQITLRFEDEAMYRDFSGQSISVKYDGDNTLTSQAVTVPNLSSANSATLSLTVPYLFYQDFSGISSFNDGHDSPTVGTASDTYKGISEFSSKGLPGWYGARVGVQGGTSLRICCRYEHVLLAGAYYKGRVYTPFLSNIKDGKDVKISVSFRYGSNRSERDPVFGSRPQKQALMYFGVNTQSVVINPDQIEGDLIDNVTGLVAGSGFASATPSSLNPMVIKGETMSTSGGSYTSFEGTKTVTVDNVDNCMRLGWIVTTNNTSSNTNGNYWLYIDDIKVQVANN